MYVEDMFQVVSPTTTRIATKSLLHPRLHEIFQNAQRRDIAEPLAAALLGVGNSDPIASPELPEIVEVWEPFVEKARWDRGNGVWTRPGGAAWKANWWF